MSTRLVELYQKQPVNVCLFGTSRAQRVDTARRYFNVHATNLRRRSICTNRSGSKIDHQYLVGQGFSEINMTGMQPKVFSAHVERWISQASPHERVHIRDADLCTWHTRKMLCYWLNSPDPRHTFIVTCSHPTAVHPQFHETCLCFALSPLRTSFNRSPDPLEEAPHGLDKVMKALKAQSRTLSVQELREVCLILEAIASTPGPHTCYLEALRGYVDI